MASTLLGKKQWNSTWGGLPGEIRLLILEVLMRDGCTLSRLATVSREWQTILEQHNFARIRLTQWRVKDFSSIIHHNRALVKYIWFCLEIDDYDCTSCQRSPSRELWPDELSTTDTDHCLIASSFHHLFSALSTWDPNGDLKLDISVYSPSDSRHWVKYFTFLPDGSSDMLDGGGDIEQTTSEKVFHDPQHGWVAGSRQSAPPRAAIARVFRSLRNEGTFDNELLDYEWWCQLQTVPVVTSLLLRQQNRRRWLPEVLAHMFSRFPRLQEVHYEPWREWDWMQALTDISYEYLLNSIRRRNTNLKRLVVFENFNQEYPTIMPVFLSGQDLTKCDSTRIPAENVGRKVALASLSLEHLAASFIVDTSHFFQIEPAWEWPSLTSLVLTSTLLTPDEKPTEIGAMLQAAAAAALKMPKLETIEIWNGRKGLAALFKYQASSETRQGTITWRGTWELAMEPAVIEAWEAVVRQHPSWRLSVVQEWLDEGAIKSHGDAIHYLMLSGQVIRPVSLQQIRMEQRVLEGAEAV